MSSIDTQSSCPRWLECVSEVVASAEEFKDWAHFEVTFVWQSGRAGLSLPSGTLTTGKGEECILSASEAIFDGLVAGSLVLQQAHLAGDLALSGKPDCILRLAMVYDLVQKVEAQRVRE